MSNIQPLPQPTQSVVFELSDREIDGKLVQTVNARDLHKFLNVGKYFANWIKDRIAQYDFVADLDYTTTVAKTGNRKNVRSIEYFLTLNMAKELCMVERNDKGKQARRYFIECERRLQSLSGTERCTKWDRFPLYGFVVNTVLQHRVLFPKVYTLLNTYVKRQHFRDMTKDEVAEVLEFADRFSEGLDTRQDWIRLESNYQQMYGEQHQMAFLQGPFIKEAENGNA